MEGLDKSKALSEQTVLVTGAGRGLGVAIATVSAGEGAQVIIDYRNSEGAAEAFNWCVGSLLRAVLIRARLIYGQMLRLLRRP